MIKKVEASSPGTNEEDLQYILDNIDVDNYFDYMAFEMFFGNSDPGNIRYLQAGRGGAEVEVDFLRRRLWAVPFRF